MEVTSPDGVGMEQDYLTLVESTNGLASSQCLCLLTGHCVYHSSGGDQQSVNILTGNAFNIRAGA